MGSEYVQEITIDQNNIVKCSISKFNPLAMLQSGITDYPYQSWKLRSIGDNVALLDIETKRLKLVFEIGEDYVKLIERDEPELAHIVNKPLAPGYLLHLLSKSGIHLMPVDMDSKLAGIQLKSTGAELFALNEIMVGI